ncbi:class II histone deacetylase [Tabrizicola sp. TH137]|uniref:class II histone deacetylase n=1 Tax=Tabrizicola sp. TH137 TaxID=2067452 RepID=UPI000C7BF0B2|nr:class II histone deacetylase [Tabrizicola sp. TH137]PLL11533.1 class II histone deacetylase [Tabrizicola sp. TH137]
MTTAFYSDERCFWHHGGNYALTLPVGGPMGGLVQPGAGLPESPETKRRLKNLLEVTGLLATLSQRSAPPAARDDLLRVHPAAYLDRFKSLSDADGGELGPRAPFGKGGYDIASLSAGLAKQALIDVLAGRATNAYALCRPPGHHCLPDRPNGFCLLANIAIAIRAAQAATPFRRFAVIDWDVHHGNGTEAIFLDDPEILAISLHQDRNYPTDTGGAEVRGKGAAKGTNLNIPLPPGTGHKGYLEAFQRLVLPALHAHRPDAILIACGFDAAALDPLGRMLATADTFRQMTRLTREAAETLCDGRLVAVHEGGYSEAYLPFCGHAVIAELAQSPIDAPDPLAATLAARQPDARFDAFLSAWIDDLDRLFTSA